MEEMERGREIFDLATIGSPQQGCIGAGKRIPSPLLHEHRRLPCFRPLASPAVPTAHVAAHPLHEMSTCLLAVASLFVGT